MSTWISVARTQLTDRNLFVVQPWVVLGLDFLIVLAIAGSTPANGHARYSGALAGIYCVIIVTGALSIARQLPFALALGVSRRSFYAGTTMAALAVAAVYGLALSVLQLIERASGGWGINLYFFRVPYWLAGPWYLSWLTSFTGLALMFAWGMWFGLVYRRWNLPGLLTFIAAQAIVVAAVVVIAARANAWLSIGRFFTTLSAAGLTGVLAVLTVVLAAGGYATIRRVTV